MNISKDALESLNIKNKVLIIDSEKNLGIITLEEAFSTSSNVAVARMVLKKYKHNPRQIYTWSTPSKTV